MGYSLKKTVRKRQRVRLRDKVKPFGRTINLDTATQKQLKFLYEELHHPFVEKVDKKKNGADK